MKRALVVALVCASATVHARPKPLFTDWKWTKGSACHVQLLPAPDAERSRVLELAHARFGAKATIALSPIHDHVARVTGMAIATHATDDAGVLAAVRELLDKNTDVLGITSAWGKLEPRVVSNARKKGPQEKMKPSPTASIPGWRVSAAALWEASGLSQRADVVVMVSPDGTITEITVGGTVYPSFAICDPDAARQDPRLLKAALGAKPSYRDDNGDTHAVGPIKAGELTKDAFGVHTYADEDDPYTVSTVLRSELVRGKRHWEVLVDSETFKLISVEWAGEAGE